MLPAGSIVGALYGTTSCKHSLVLLKMGEIIARRNYRPKQVELIEIINKPLLLHLVGYLYYWQMGFNSVFKGTIETTTFRLVAQCLKQLRHRVPPHGMW